MIDTMQFRQRINDLAEQDFERRVFGCELHEYELGACLSESEIKKLEAAYQIQVPEEYRSFLINVGNGGTGPGYGLAPFRSPVAPQPPINSKMVVTVTDKDGSVVHEANFEDIAVSYDTNRTNNTVLANKEFPLSSPFRSITDEMWDVQIPNWDTHLQLEHGSRKEAFKKIAFGHGVLKIAHYGSGIYAVLVMNGQFHGQVWLTDPQMGDYVPISMRTDLHDTTIKTENAYSLHQVAFGFNSWYDHWLKSAMWQLENGKAR